MADSAVTVVITSSGVAGHETEFREFQQELRSAASRFAGFLSYEVIEPSPPVQRAWVVIQRFESTTHALGWLQSDARRNILDSVIPALTSMDNICLFHENSKVSRAGAVSVLISTKVKDGRESDFNRWREEMFRVQAGFPGYLGCRWEPPIPGVQEWTAIIQFDSDANLEYWLNSDARKSILEQADMIENESDAQKLRGGFEEWFASDREKGFTPAWKQNHLVLLSLYPIVMLEIIFLDPLLGWIQRPPLTFLANAVSVALLSWPLIPLTEKAFGWWLHPAHSGHRLRTEASGVFLLCVLYTGLVMFFWFLASHVHFTGPAKP